MKIIKIDQGEWQKGLARAAEGYRLIGPVKTKAHHAFRTLDAGQMPDFGFLNSRLSPKSLIYPQSEVMFEYSLDESAADHHILKEPAKDYSPRAVIGIRPCDAKAFVLVRQNFDTADYKDPYWLRAYEATTFVGLACDAPCRTCFCTTAGCGPHHEEGLDVLLIAEQDGGYLAKVITEKGAAFMAAAGFRTPAGAEAPERLASLKEAAEGRIVSRVKTENLRAMDSTELYNAPFWEDVSFSCINCGTCTFCCPTCWCFDIQDENRGRRGVRIRNWDSCMEPLFTLHGSGHNPRGTKLHRVRQRFMHKLKYFVDKYDSGIQCVGCGRCIQLCPVNIDIRRVCNLMNDYSKEKDACAVG
jgi:ferredoxin